METESKSLVLQGQVVAGNKRAQGNFWGGE